MLELLLAFFIGRSFYNLAHDYDKHNWGFAIIGVLTYYVGTFIGGFILGFILVTIGSSINSLFTTLISLPVGLLACFGLYYLLRKDWEKKASEEIEIIDEIGKE